jgi:hypothetical protein
MSSRNHNESPEYDSQYEDSHYTAHDDPDEDYYENSQQVQSNEQEDHHQQQQRQYYDDDSNYYDRDEDDDDDDDDRHEQRPILPYEDQPYIPSNDTGEGMMVYDETIEDDPLYDYDPDEDEDGEREPMMPDDYYGDEPHDEEEYYDEDEDERRRRTRRRRAWCCCLMLLCCLLLLIILLLIFLLGGKDPQDEVTPAPTFAPFVDDTDDDFYYDDDIILMPGVVTSPMAPIDYDCDYDNNELGFANVWDQCNCDGSITDVPDDVLQMRQLLIDRMASKFYEEGEVLDSRSCEPRNMALIWLASGDNRDSGEPRQRFALALAYYQLNGTIWDYDDEWLGELNECLWLGVQCNNRDAVNSFAVESNNIFGHVSVVFFFGMLLVWDLIAMGSFSHSLTDSLPATTHHIDSNRNYGHEGSRHHCHHP